MSAETEFITNRVVIQPKGTDGEIDVYRMVNKVGIFSDRVAFSHETFLNQDTAAERVDERGIAAFKSVTESTIHLGLSAATTAIIFVEALRRRSKLLAVAGLVSGAGAIYANGRKAEYAKELKWLEKEAVALEEYEDDHPTPAQVK